MLRIGTFKNFKRSSFLVTGFLIFGLVEYLIFAPVYWFMLLRNTLPKHEPDPPADRPHGKAAPDVR
ncbi:MAG: hypothetical protein EXS33_03340 [Pedosphaera sp.]|nr:hypothetical protein [Pedosphaera sp.]